jgi:hypothetical protein
MKKEIVMKNTVKKILALVFVVAMVCSLAVPAFATEETIKVNVTVVDYDGTANQKAEVTLTLKKANVEEAVKAYNAKVAESTSDALTVAVDYSGTTGQVTKVGGLKASEVTYTPAGASAPVAGNVFGTGYWAVALNGKLVAEDMATVTIEDGDSIVVYWNDTTFGTKLVQVDDSAIAQGIVSLYYYDAEGNRQPLVGAKLTLSTSALGTGVVRDYTNIVAADKTNRTLTAEYHFTTDEKGQIWIAPEYLDIKDGKIYYINYAKANNVAGANNAIELDGYESNIIKPLDAVTKEDGYTDKEVAYYNANLDRNIVDVEVIGNTVVVEAGLYNVAGATGDMTVVYALVAFAAVATIAAVVVMKKKSVKAN